MLQLMPPTLVIAYVLFSTFAFYQAQHVKQFRGRNKTFGLVLTWSAFLASLFGYGFAFYYGLSVRWYLPLVLFAIGVAVQSVWFAIEAKYRLHSAGLVLSLAGFVVWPLAAVWMVLALPSAPAA